VALLNPFDKRTAKVLFTALVFAVGLLFLYAAWRALLAFLFAIFFAYLLEAPVARLQKLVRGSRPLAVALVYLLFVGLLVVVFAMAGPPVMKEAQTLRQKAPEMSQNIMSGQIVQQVGSQRGWSQETVDKVRDFVIGFFKEHRQEIVSAAQTLVVSAASTIQDMWWLLLVPILAIFFLLDGDKFAQMIIKSVEDTRNRQIVASTVDAMNSMLGAFIRAQITLSVLAVVVITLVLSLMKVPYALALGPAAGALEFIPVVGPVIGIVVVMAVAFMSGYGHLFWLLLFLLVWRGIQDYVSSPRIMGTTLELHPLVVLFGIFAGGEVAGVIGVFLSIPVMATFRILWHTWQTHRQTAGGAARSPQISADAR
jgi:predicted PurR-regulated permease PerM